MQYATLLDKPCLNVHFGDPGSHMVVNLATVSSIAAVSGEYAAAAPTSPVPAAFATQR